MLPIIAIGRESIVKDRTISNKLDANYPHLYTSSQKSYNAKEAYSNFNLLNNRTPSRQFNMTVIPSYVKIKYKCLIQTYYVEQLDKIIEAIEYASDSYWGEPDRFKFRAFIDEFSTSVELIAEQKRSAKSTFTLELRGYIIADNIQKDLTAIKKVNEKTKLNMNLIWNEQNAGTSTAASTERPWVEPNPQWYGYTSATLTYTYENSNSNLTQFLDFHPEANVIVETYDPTKYVIFLSNTSNASIYDVNNFLITKAFTKTQISQQLLDGSYTTLYQYKTKEPATIGTYKLR